jgi:hypothetical protein
MPLLDFSCDYDLFVLWVAECKKYTHEWLPNFIWNDFYFSPAADGIRFWNETAHSLFTPQVAEGAQLAEEEEEEEVSFSPVLYRVLS